MSRALEAGNPSPRALTEAEARVRLETLLEILKAAQDIDPDSGIVVYLKRLLILERELCRL